MDEAQRREFWISAGLIPRSSGPVPHDLTTIRRWPKYCEATVIREGEEDACNKTAIAAITTWFEGEWHTWPICAYHAHMLGGREYTELVPLTALLLATVNPSRT